MIDNKTLDLINEKTDIVALVSEFVSLEKVGKNYRGLCPFHNEKTPSFSVSPEKNIAKCMGCGEGGNPINFYRKIKNISLGESAAILAEKAGIPIKTDTPKAIDKNEKYYQLLEEATEFYQFVLNNSAIGKEALDYLAKREITENTINHFKIGVSPKTRDVLYRMLNDKGYKVSDMIDLGLVKQDNDGYYYDLFTNRLMFPITNAIGKTVGFSGRALDNNDQIKYVNSPETIVFKKGLLLYNYFESLVDAKKNKHVILVEGFFDCISPYQIGIKNIVASMGTALTDDQVKLLKKATDQVLVCYDGDTAGQKATVAAIDKLLAANIRVEVLKIPDGLDPDEFIKQYGADRFESLFGEYVIDGYRFVYDYHKAGKDFKNANDIKQFKDAMLKFLRKTDQSIRDFYGQLIKNELGFILESHSSKANMTVKPTIIKKKRETKRYDPIEEHIILAVLKDNSLINFVEDNFKLYVDIKNDERIRILQVIYQIKNNEETIDKTVLLKYLVEEAPRRYLLSLDDDIFKNKGAIIDIDILKEYKNILSNRQLDLEIEDVIKLISLETDSKKKIKLAEKRDNLIRKKENRGK